MRLACLPLLLACLAACTPYPRDPDRTLERVRGGMLLAGVSHDPPHVVLPVAGKPSGADVARIEALARSVDARVQWVRTDHEGLMHALHVRRLHVVAGGVAADSPWTSKVGMTRPYPARDAHGREVRRVMAVPPGENAWLMQVESIVHPVAR